ncbi:MAG: DEAD/DEAH box helicase [Clostridiales bacterium]|nr:DEAD/DEAH box helicase [Clostridiales bacterium]
MIDLVKKKVSEEINVKKSFIELGVSNEVARAVKEMGFEEPTFIQSLCIPKILNGIDVIGQSQTGSGKTAAFGIPAIEKVSKNSNLIEVLILCPTRELAIQGCDEIRKFARHKAWVKVIPIYGGQSIDRQIKLFEYPVSMIIGTPGRVMDLMRRNVLHLDKVKVVVLDEADEMLNMGFKEDIEKILKDVPNNRQTILFSATMSPEIIKITKEFQKNPEHVKMVHHHLTVPTIEQYYFDVPRGVKKVEILCNTLDTYNPSRTIIFCNTKKQVEELMIDMQNRGFMVLGLHGDMKQNERTRVMSSFKNGKVDILIATDVAARGIDVDSVEIVFNYDIPQDEEYYVHRIGRTGRAGKSGKAFTLVSGRNQLHSVYNIQRFTGKKIEFKMSPSRQDVYEIKQHRMLSKVRKILKEDELKEYVEVINILVEEEYSSLEIAAAILKMNCEDIVPSSFNKNSLDKNLSDSVHSFKPRFKDVVKFRVEIGKNNLVSASHILSAIATQTNFSGKDVGKITLYDKYSIFEVPRSWIDTVKRTMENCKIKGIKVRALLVE